MIEQIVIHRSGRAWGGVLEISQEHVASGLPSIGHHVVIGSMFPTRVSYDSGSPLRVLDGRVEIGRAVGR